MAPAGREVRWHRTGCAVALAVLAAGCSTFRKGEPLGSRNNPVRADGRPGEIAYLGRLRCPSGGAPHFHFQRRGPSSPHGNPLDRFTLRCVIDNRSFDVFVDRHHEGYVEERAVAGLAIADAATWPSVETWPSGHGWPDAGPDD